MEMDYSTISVRITAEEKEALLQYCKDNDLSMSQVLRKAIKDIIQKNQE
jgi:antitoxin component of RelBE/YafQ-DinJ toxin-antitoxin module